MDKVKRELHRSLEGLKDFQKATVRQAFRRLFERSGGRILVADEVGLGKTIVARGVIAEAVLHHIEQNPCRPFQVAYICSNQAIAQENQQKLQPFHSHMAAPMYGRIAELSFAPPNTDGRVLDINSLTPATSFNVTQGAGNWIERMIIYRLLLGFFPSYEGELKEWVRDAVTLDSWEQKLLSSPGTRPLRPGLSDRFHLYLTMNPADFSRRKQSATELGIDPESPVCLLKAIEKILSELRQKNRPVWARWDLLVFLRRALVECCIDYIDADLFILDEFQRFRSLLNEDEGSEEARIAQRIFSKTGSRILLLSATPFKAFSGDDDRETGEAHYEELRKVLDFLAKDDPDDLQQFEDARRDIYRQLTGLGTGALQPEDMCEKPKNRLENLLARYICRTERAIAAGSGNLMLQDSWKTLTLPFSNQDIDTFCAIDRLAQVLARPDLTARGLGGAIEYAKSAPFPMSYLDGYQFKEILRRHKDHPEVKRALSQSSCAWLNEGEVSRYRLNLSKASRKDGGGNARLKQLVGQAIGESGHQLLWIPPSYPYYKLSGPFAGQETFSKTLVFSSWQLVPKMIGTLLSYEIERRTIGADSTIKSHDRRYFHGDNQYRHPRPLLRFRSKEGDSSTMTLFTLLYPSRVLVDLVEDELFRDQNRSYGEIKNALAEKINILLSEVAGGIRTDPRGKSPLWYWFAPFLLDRLAGFNDSLNNWVERKGGLPPSNKESDQDQDLTALKGHFQSLAEILSNGNLAMGDFPPDLAEHLAALALGSPAVGCQRSLRRLFPDLAPDHLMTRATQLASGFLEMYNKPEAISAIRLSVSEGYFWQQALVYGGQGCLHAMVDEYLHMLLEQTGSLDAVVVRFLNSINIFTTSVKVESLKGFSKGKKKKMRCHYAVEMGNQKIETEGGQKRVANIRESFNSPFRPFVLASTSIGQEGLDFHWYCRRIVHWNLPSNPIDLEQREGRINRYKSLVIRRRVAARYGSLIKRNPSQGDLWAHLMALAEQDSSRAQHCQLQPYWHLEGDDEVEAIERLVPLYPFSRDQEKLYESLKVLAFYRLTFGQPRQEELLNFMLKREFSPQQVALIKERLMIDLSPLMREKKRLTEDAAGQLTNEGISPISRPFRVA